MNNNTPVPIDDEDDEMDEYPELTQADFERAVFPIGLKPAQRRQGVSIVLDANIVEYFKGIAGEGAYQILINDTLREAVISLSLSEERPKLEEQSWKK